jgi:hypothetical protein
MAWRNNNMAATTHWLESVGHTALLALMVVLFNACQTAPTARSSATATQPADPALRANLTELAKGHRDKVQFAWYATTLRRLDPAVGDFAQRMGSENKRLFDQLDAWAKARKIDLTFHYDDSTVAGRARQTLEKSQETIIRDDNAADFQRDLLIMMWTDYQGQRYLSEVMAKDATDPELKAFLNANASMLAAGVKEIRGLLAKYKFEK